MQISSSLRSPSVHPAVSPAHALVAFSASLGLEPGAGCGGAGAGRNARRRGGSRAIARPWHMSQVTPPGFTWRHDVRIRQLRAGVAKGGLPGDAYRARGITMNVHCPPRVSRRASITGAIAAKTREGQLTPGARRVPSRSPNRRWRCVAERARRAGVSVAEDTPASPHAF